MSLTKLHRHAVRRSKASTSYWQIFYFSIWFLRVSISLALKVWFTYPLVERLTIARFITYCHISNAGGVPFLPLMIKFEVVLYHSCTQQTQSLWETCALLSAIALGKEGFALGKAFVECCTRQRAVGISLHGKCFFTECRMSGTRQKISRVPRRHLAKKSRRDG